MTSAIKFREEFDARIAQRGGVENKDLNFTQLFMDLVEEINEQGDTLFCVIPLPEAHQLHIQPKFDMASFVYFNDGSYALMGSLYDDPESATMVMGEIPVMGYIPMIADLTMAAQPRDKEDEGQMANFQKSMYIIETALLPTLFSRAYSTAQEEAKEDPQIIVPAHVRPH